MTHPQTAALQNLLERVEAGKRLTMADTACLGQGRGQLHTAKQGLEAYNGSLDAAKALHEAVLPGWFPGVSQNIHSGEWLAWVQDKVTHHFSRSGADPARAWLIAILRALIATTDTEGR